MKSLVLSWASSAIIPKSTSIINPPSPFADSSLPKFPLKPSLRLPTITPPRISSIPPSSEEHPLPDSPVPELRVPHHWLLPSKALEESEWLRVTLHKWLDDEYCPEPTNVEISKVAARSYYESLLEKQTDVGEILLKMVHELESISYQESFHGAFSSANAAVNLIVQRIEQA